MRNATTRHDGNGLLARAADWFATRGWLQGANPRLSDSDLQMIANDLGVTEADLLDVLPRAPDSSLLMDRMMEARGLHPDQVRGSSAALVRDLELTCTRCSAKRRCQHDLKAGTAAESCHEYCGNAEIFDELLDGAAPR
ncbi:MAG: DUF6455 family protein [Acetobacteraceae bacterium]